MSLATTINTWLKAKSTSVASIGLEYLSKIRSWEKFVVAPITKREAMAVVLFWGDCHPFTKTIL